MNVRSRLAEVAVVLGTGNPPPGAAFENCIRLGSLVFVSGHIARLDG